MNNMNNTHETETSMSKFLAEIKSEKLKSSGYREKKKSKVNFVNSWMDEQSIYRIAAFIHICIFIYRKQ